MYDGASKIKGLMPLPSAQKFLNLFDPYFPSWQIHRDIFIFIEASQPPIFCAHRIAVAIYDELITIEKS